MSSAKIVTPEKKSRFGPLEPPPSSSKKGGREKLNAQGDERDGLTPRSTSKKKKKASQPSNPGARSTQDAPKIPVPDALQGLVAPHLDSFNFFALRGLPAAVRLIDPVEIHDKTRKLRFKVWVENPVVDHPVSEDGTCRPIFPSECREGGFSYRGELHANICIECFEASTDTMGEVEEEEEEALAILRSELPISFGRMPIMVKSSFCHLAGMCQGDLVKKKEEALEMGGYFVCNGIERLIRLIIAPRRNYVIALKRGSMLKKGVGFTDLATSIRCVRPDESSVTLRVVYLADGSAVVTFSVRRREFFIPVGIILKALLEVTDAELYSRIVAIVEGGRGEEDRDGGMSGGEKRSAASVGLGTDFVRERALLVIHHARSKGLFTRADCLAYLGRYFRSVMDVPSRRSDAAAGEKLLRDYVLVHLDSADDKFNLLIFMVQKLYALADGTVQEDNADAFSHHEALLPGQLLVRLVKERIEMYLKKLVEIAEKLLKDKPGQTDLRNATSFRQVLQKVPLSIGQAVENFLNTGNIASPSGLDLQQASGFTLVAEKLNFLRYISHFRSIHRGAYFATLRTTTIRKLLPESWGFLCPVHTPDGAPCGLLNHLTLPCLITTDLPLNPKPNSFAPSAPATPAAADADESRKLAVKVVKSRDAIARAVVRLLSAWGFRPSAGGLPPPPPPAFLGVQLDGLIIGHLAASAATAAVSALRKQKVAGDNVIPADLEVAYIPFSPMGTFPGIFLFSTPARFVRPVLQLSDAARNHPTEFIGSLEQVYMEIRCPDGGRGLEENATGAMVVNPVTHEELHPSAMLSVVANLTPWSDFNQSPRNMYQCQMGKQTMGFPLQAYRHRSDNKLYRLLTPQTPVARTKTYGEYAMDDYPTGTNAVVAVLAYTGYDMEDAMIINKSSMERGFCHGQIVTTQVVDNTPKGGGEASGIVFKRIVKPGGGATAIDEDGLPLVGQRLKAEEAYCSMWNTATMKPTFQKLKGSEEAIVDAVTLQGQGPKQPLTKVSIRMRFGRNPVIGDKFSSRHGQKGVLSQLWPDVDMPFCSASGMRPDIIINPHAFPSRMTIGMLIESMASKAGSLHGYFVNASPFRSSVPQKPPLTWSSQKKATEASGAFSTPRAKGQKRVAGADEHEESEENLIDEFGRQLVTKGFSYSGTETMYSGIYGTEMTCDIFIGVVYYQRLRHMVSDKFQVRSTGPVNPLTQQPVKGRKKGGGIRFGEMERDALLSHGAAFLLHDRLHACSDYHTASVCSKCGSLLSPAPQPPRADPVLTLGLQGGGEAARTRRVECRICGAGGRIRKVAMPYVFKFLAAELSSMNIRLTLSVSD